MTPNVAGAPPRTDRDREQYLIKKLEEMRKDCQWLLGLGAVGVLGIVLKGDIGVAFVMRATVALISTTQILISMGGAMSWRMVEVDSAQYDDRLHSRLRLRYRLRNLSLLLLALSYILLIGISLGASP